MPDEEAAPAAAPPAAPPAPAPMSAPPRRRGPYQPRRKVCRFCVEQVRDVDWKQFQLLRTFTTERGKILSSRITGTCAKHQRQLTTAIKLARHLALLPFVTT